MGSSSCRPPELDLQDGTRLRGDEGGGPSGPARTDAPPAGVPLPCARRREPREREGGVEIRGRRREGASTTPATRSGHRRRARVGHRSWRAARRGRGGNRNQMIMDGGNRNQREPDLQAHARGRSTGGRWTTDTLNMSHRIWMSNERE